MPMGENSGGSLFDARRPSDMAIPQKPAVEPIKARQQDGNEKVSKLILLHGTRLHDVGSIGNKLKPIRKEG